MSRFSIRAWLLIAVCLGTVSIAGYVLSRDNAPELVVYCAHDSVYSEPLLRKFEQETGIRVTVRFDTEATKSLGLTQLILRERDHPRCDVFWNNEVPGTAALQEEGLLHPYQGPGFQRIPTAFKDPAGHWTGFAARLRVYIVNTEKLAATPEAVAEAFAREDLSRIAIAKPLYGTTLTQYSLRWHEEGGEALQAWHKAALEHRLQVVNGNATTKNLVAQGQCDVAWTDTDDYFVAQDAGRPVAMLPVRLESGKTICIPNSVAIIQGTRRLPEAQRLVDYLLSAESELALAKSQSRQIPLGPLKNDADLPVDVKQLVPWAQEGADLNGLGPARAACLAWLMEEYGP